MGRLHLAAVLSLSTVLMGCSDARIAMPGDLQSSTEQLSVTGMGGSQDGRFRLGASEGRFTRRATQTTAFNTFVRNAGGGSFEVAGPEFAGTAGGRCEYDEGEVKVAGAELPNGRLTYRCRFHRGGAPIEGGLFLAEVPNGSGLLAGRTRAGDLQVGGVRMNIRPIHRMESSALPAGTPLGYAFDVAGRPVGAVDLNGTNKTIYAPRQAGPERDAVLMAALALSVFWDPGA